MLVESCRTCLISDTGGQLSRNVIGENNFDSISVGVLSFKNTVLWTFLKQVWKFLEQSGWSRGNTVKKDPWWPMSRPAFATRTTGKRTPWQDILWRNTNEGDRTIIGENIFHLKACFHLQFGSHVLYPFLFVDLVCRVLSYYYSISITKSLEAHCKFQTLCWGISDKLVWSSCDAKRFPNCKIHSEFNVSDSQVVNVTASWSYISYDFIWRHNMSIIWVI